MRYLVLMLALVAILFSQDLYNHPELDWKTLDTEHVNIHFYSEAGLIAREGAYVAEYIYPKIIKFYGFEPHSKTHIIFYDTKDYSNGITYFYENKIIIWASPLDLILRGSHRWLQNVLTHEFGHIVSLQKALKTPIAFQGLYFQWIDYEEEKRPDVLYGFPNKIVSQILPSSSVPPWLAEGVAQFMFSGADWDIWDTHRDMLLRDQILNDTYLTFDEMNNFGKKGIGNEYVYNTGYAFCNYLAEKYGAEKLSSIFDVLSKPNGFSVNKAMRSIYGKPGRKLYDDFISSLKIKYEYARKLAITTEQTETILTAEGSINIYPKWSPAGDAIVYLSNSNGEYISETDLYMMDIETGERNIISKGVTNPASWIDNERIIYSKVSGLSDFRGYRYNDIYVYDIIKESENLLKANARAFSPVSMTNDSLIYYIAMDNSYQKIFVYDVANDERNIIFENRNRLILHTLNFDQRNDQLLLDYTENHFRNTAKISPSDITFSVINANPNIDERDIVSLYEDAYLYSTDSSGIFNLYVKHDSAGTFITNVAGGAFMPDVNENGDIVFSVYKNGKYKIAIMPSEFVLPVEKVGLSRNITERNVKLNDPIIGQNQDQASGYIDQFSRMFISPRIVFDYGTIKPGLYFYSSEILDRMNIFGSAAINRLSDLDLALGFSFRRFFPTIYGDVFLATRNVKKNENYSVYKIDENLRFRFLEFRAGLILPVFNYHSLDLSFTWQRYRAFVKESIAALAIDSGIAYDYFHGSNISLQWSSNLIKRRFDSNINPSKGFKIDILTSYEFNDFINGLQLSDVGTLTEDFKSNDLFRTTVNFNQYLEIPNTNRWTLKYGLNMGWISNQDANSFFHFFGGGLNGMLGYPFYAFNGTKLFANTLEFNFPIFREKTINIGWIQFQNSTLGLVYQVGDAWTDSFRAKQSVGIQWKLSGFSFYNYPLALTFSSHYGLTKFENSVADAIISYGKQNRYYFTLLFGF